MPAALRMVSAWTDLEAAGGTCFGAIWPWSSLVTSYRADGDDTVRGSFVRPGLAWTDLPPGVVLRYERADDSIEEWVIQSARAAETGDRFEITATSVRSWLRARIILRNDDDFSLSGSGTLESILDVMIATTEWPSWLVRGTVDRNPTVSYAWDATDALTALEQLVSAANATEDVTLHGETVRLVLRRVNATQYAIDLLTSVVSGDPLIVEGKNLRSFATNDVTTERATAIYPVNASGASITEAHFVARSTSTGKVELRDSSYRPDDLLITYDGQWTGYYLVQLDGTTSAILGSDASTQEVFVADESPWATWQGTITRLSADASGVPIVAVADTTQAKATEVLRGTWGTKINWMPNCQWHGDAGGGYPQDWSQVGSGPTLMLGTSDVETGTHTLDVTMTATTEEIQGFVGIPDEYLSPGGGTQNWTAGWRIRRTAGAAQNLVMRVSLDNGSTWSTPLGGAITGSYQSLQGTFTTSSAMLPNRLIFQWKSGSSGTCSFRIERLWLFRTGTDDGDNTLRGNGPVVGVYEAGRMLKLRRFAGRTYQVGVIDRHRDNPTGFPNDNLLVNQEARVVVPSRSVDVTLPIASLEVDELHHQKTNAQFGAPKRRLADLL